MKRSFLLAAVVAGVVLASSSVWPDDGKVKPAPNGITLPEGYKDWRVISSSYRTDNHTLRVIVGNDLAIQAARAGKTNPLAGRGGSRQASVEGAGP